MRAYPVTTAGPKALAGLMQLELMGPVIHMLKVMPRAIAKGPSFPQPLHTHTNTLLESQEHRNALCISRQLYGIAHTTDLQAAASGGSIGNCSDCSISQTESARAYVYCNNCLAASTGCGQECTLPNRYVKCNYRSFLC